MKRTKKAIFKGMRRLVNALDKGCCKAFKAADKDCLESYGMGVIPVLAIAAFKAASSSYLVDSKTGVKYIAIGDKVIKIGTEE